MSLTILLACYEGAHWLQEQLDSLSWQDYPDFKVLMQDDGSQDATFHMLAQRAADDSRFCFGYENSCHFGAVGNFWSLLRQDGADYTALCDQDDIWESDRLSRCMSAMNRAEVQYGPDVPILVHSDCRVMTADGHILHDSFFTHQGWDRSAITLNRLLVQNNVTGCTVLMNAALRHKALEIGDPRKMVMHDWFLALTAAAFGRIVLVDAPLVRYRQHGSNVKGASNENLTRRGIKALGAWEKGRNRIELTYRHTEDFKAMCGHLLPQDSQKIIDGYLATETMRKAERIKAIRDGGYTMQSTITRIGQLLFS